VLARCLTTFHISMGQEKGRLPLGSQVLPLALQSFISEGFAVDIHPAAKIGEGI